MPIYRPKGAEPWAPFDIRGNSRFDGSKNLPKAVAIQALAQGTATEYQQQLALKCIVEDICCVNDLSFDPGNPRYTDFAEGKRFVGLEIAKLTNINYNEV